MVAILSEGQLNDFVKFNPSKKASMYSSLKSQAMK